MPRLSVRIIREEHESRGSEVHSQACDRTNRNTQPELSVRQRPIADAKRERPVIHQRTQYHEGDIAQPFSVRRLMDHCKCVPPVQKPSPARGCEEGRDPGNIGADLSCDDERL